MPNRSLEQRLEAFIQKLQAVLQANGITQLSSHLLKNNTASIALHRKLGFISVQENDLAVAFELNFKEQAAAHSANDG